MAKVSKTSWVATFLSTHLAKSAYLERPCMRHAVILDANAVFEHAIILDENVLSFQDTPIADEEEEDEGADDIFIDDAGDESDEDGGEIDEDAEDATVEAEQEEDAAGEEMTEGGEDDEEATVEVEQDEDDVSAEDSEDGEGREGIFRRIFNLFKE